MKNSIVCSLLLFAGVFSFANATPSNVDLANYGISAYQSAQAYYYTFTDPEAQAYFQGQMDEASYLIGMANSGSYTVPQIRAILPNWIGVAENDQNIIGQYSDTAYWYFQGEIDLDENAESFIDTH